MKNLTPAEYLANKASYHLVDVRSDMEWESVHEKEAIHVPLTDLIDRASSLPKDKPLVFTCRSGGRSSRACQMLEGSGLETFNLAGGMHALVLAKYEKGLISKEECEKMLEKISSPSRLLQ